jgi:hypothetical protein
VLLAVWVAFCGPAFVGSGRSLRTTAVARAAQGLGADAKKAKKSKKKQKTRLDLKDALNRKDQKEELEEWTPVSGSKKTEAERREDAKLAPEMIFYEGAPSPTELVIPFFSCFFVLGIIPFVSALARQKNVKYKITTRRISVGGGWDGGEVTEFSYKEIRQMKYGMRFLGYCGDVNIILRDGARVEMFSLPKFKQNYDFILSNLSEEQRKNCDPSPDLKEDDEDVELKPMAYSESA